jgi:small subunit ribosomal protein S3
VSVVKHFIEDSIKKAEIDEFLRNEFERAGYGGVSITKTPLGTHLVIYTMRPGIVIGRGGETIRELATVLEEKFQLPSPQISVAEIEIPELNAQVVASRIASALKRGVHYRRAGFWGLNQIMGAGALGAEVIISGKLRTDRARYEKFRTGYLPKSGEPPRKYMRTSEMHVQLKPGILGVKVRIIPPDSEFPDQVQVQIIEEEFEGETEGEKVEKKGVETEKVPKPSAPVDEKESEPKALPEEEKAVGKKIAEPETPPAEEKAELKEKVAEPKVPVEKKLTKKKATGKKRSGPKKKAETKEKVVEKTAPSAKKKKVTKKKTSKPEVPPVEKKKVEKKKKTKSTVSPAKEKKATKKKATKTKAAKSKSSAAKTVKKKKAKPTASPTKKAKKAGK